jgi:UDP-N-acetylmuramoyl-L-alanyl-D-glutamate--2,6-diaminopimelate ligase
MSMPAHHMITEPTLATLLQGWANAPATPVSGIASDSRLLRQGDLFLACGGYRTHGLDYIDDAIAAGVAAIAYDSSTAETPDAPVDVPIVAVPNLANQLGEIANRFFDHPSASVNVVGVTGTNGKTTVAWLITQCCRQLAQRCGYIGTLGAGIGQLSPGGGMTTPGTIELHQRLAEFRDAGAGWAAVEVSSHALEQRRVDGIGFDTVMFTNLSRDHLDYHGDMRSYGEAKARLFVDYPARHRIINLDSEFGAELAARCGQEVVTVSTRLDRVANGSPYVFARSVVASADGSKITFDSSWGQGTLRLPLPGDFNVANAMLVLAALLSHNVPTADACRALESVTAPPGRMERVTAQPRLPSVYIDYAHTPEALDVALNALQPHCLGALWCVFGCGGERDAGKRALMGRVAELRADRVVITSDNPRNESPAAIIDDIASGLDKPECATILEDRAAAIAWAIDRAGPDDTILIAGKGHEDYQRIGSESIEFSDSRIAHELLERRAEGDG